MRPSRCSLSATSGRVTSRPPSASSHNISCARDRVYFFSVMWSPTAWSERQAQSIHVLDATAKGEGLDYQAECASWFAALRGTHFDRSDTSVEVFKHNQLTAYAGKDLWVFSKFFSNGKGILPATGVFVEFGALDGKIHSNTNFFEAHLNWHGVLAEPSEQFGLTLEQNRPRSLVFQVALCGKSGLRNFVDTPWPGRSGLEDTYDQNFLADMKAGRSWFNITSIKPVQCLSLQELLDRANLQHVSYMSVDTPGSEYEILKEFPFDKYQVDLIQVEVRMKYCLLMRKGRSREDPWKYTCSQRGAVEKVKELMMSSGYALADIFVVDVGGQSRSSMHQRRSPFHLSGEMTADLIFHKRTGDPNGSRDEF